MDSSYKLFRNAVETEKKAWSSLMLVRKACFAKIFTTEDQRKAGCRNSDTVESCNKRVLRHCLIRAQMRADKAQHNTKLKKTDLIKQVNRFR
jgi:hypothetical protein